MDKKKPTIKQGSTPITFLITDVLRKVDSTVAVSKAVQALVGDVLRPSGHKFALYAIVFLMHSLTLC